MVNQIFNNIGKRKKKIIEERYNIFEGNEKYHFTSNKAQKPFLINHIISFCTSDNLCFPLSLGFSYMNLHTDKNYDVKKITKNIKNEIIKYVFTKLDFKNMRLFPCSLQSIRLFQRDNRKHIIICLYGIQKWGKKIGCYTIFPVLVPTWIYEVDLPICNLLITKQINKSETNNYRVFHAKRDTLKR